MTILSYQVRDSDHFICLRGNLKRCMKKNSNGHKINAQCNKLHSQVNLLDSLKSTWILKCIIRAGFVSVFRVEELDSFGDEGCLPSLFPAAQVAKPAS